MTVAELRKALEGIRDEATVIVGVTFTWDGMSGDALGSEEVEVDYDGPDFTKENANFFSIHGDIDYKEILRAAGVED